MSRSKEHVICQGCGKVEYRDHCIECDKDLGEINSHHAMRVTLGRFNQWDWPHCFDEYVCSFDCLRKFVNRKCDEAD